MLLAVGVSFGLSFALTDPVWGEPSACAEIRAACRGRPASNARPVRWRRCSTNSCACSEANLRGSTPDVKVGPFHDIHESADELFIRYALLPSFVHPGIGV